MPELSIRMATAADAEVILGLVRELAAFEQELDKVEATAEDFRREGFGPDPVFECLLAEVDGEAVGMALFFHNFSTWTGRRGIYLEDLYVRETARGRRVGEGLIRALARLAVERGCARLDLWVLHWNPARRFYERLGIEHMKEWLPYRARGEALLALAERSVGG